MYFFNYMQSQSKGKNNCSTTKLSPYLRINLVPSEWRHEYILVHKAQDQNTFLLLCKLVHITLLQYSQVCAHAACQTTPNSFQLWMAVSMCLRLIAVLLLSVLLYGFESQQSNGNIAKQKRSQTVTWLEIPKSSLGSAHQICLLPRRRGMPRVEGKRRGWLKRECTLTFWCSDSWQQKLCWPQFKSERLFVLNIS